VRAVDDDVQAVKWLRHGSVQMLEVTIRGSGGISDSADRGSDRPVDGYAGAIGLLDFRFQIVRELSTASSEELDPVIRHRVVTGGQDDAQICPQVGSQEGDGRGRQHSDSQHVGAGCGEAGHDGGFQHLAARPRVPPDYRDRTVGGIVPYQHAGGRAGDA
jgi:hypothetical protein